MKTSFATRNLQDPVNLSGNITRIILEGKVFESVKADLLYNAINAWYCGREVDYEVHLTDEHYPVDDGIRIGGDTLRVWVCSSSIEVQRLDESRFTINAEGKRTSFACNPTGEIGRYFWEFGRNIEDVSLETEATAPWDMQGNPFDATLITRVKQSREIRELAIIAEDDPELKAALAVIADRLKKPDPAVCEAVRAETDKNWDGSFFARSVSYGGDAVRHIFGW